jgi:hypothetical protein
VILAIFLPYRQSMELHLTAAALEAEDQSQMLSLKGM